MLLTSVSSKINFRLILFFHLTILLCTWDSGTQVLLYVFSLMCALPVSCMENETFYSFQGNVIIWNYHRYGNMKVRKIFPLPSNSVSHSSLCVSSDVTPNMNKCIWDTFSFLNVFITANYTIPTFMKLCLKSALLLLCWVLWLLTMKLEAVGSPIHIDGGLHTMKLISWTSWIFCNYTLNVRRVSSSPVILL